MIRWGRRRRRAAAEGAGAEAAARGEPRPAASPLCAAAARRGGVRGVACSRELRRLQRGRLRWPLRACRTPLHAFEFWDFELKVRTHVFLPPSPSPSKRQPALLRRCHMPFTPSLILLRRRPPAQRLPPRVRGTPRTLVSRHHPRANRALQLGGSTSSSVRHAEEGREGEARTPG